jgi:proline iminopeptidase
MSYPITTYNIPVTSPITSNIYNIVAEQYGNGSNYRLLISNGGPGAGYEYLIPPFEKLIPYGFTLYFYNQLGITPSDAPEVYNPPGDPSGIPYPDYSMNYYSAELEQVRQYFNIQGPKNFILGHSFGGCIMFKWAQDYPSSVNLLSNGLIFSSGVVSVPRYIDYTNQILASFPPDIQAILANPSNPLYQETANTYYNNVYLLRVVPNPPAWINTTINVELYNYMQGPSEFIINGTISNFDLFSVCPTIQVRTLVIGGIWDTVDPAMQKESAELMPKGQFYLTNGSHNSEWDDPCNYFNALLTFMIGQPIPSPLLTLFGFKSIQEFKTQGNKKMSGQVQRVKAQSNLIGTMQGGQWNRRKLRQTNQCYQKFGLVLTTETDLCGYQTCLKKY